MSCFACLAVQLGSHHGVGELRALRRADAEGLSFGPGGYEYAQARAAPQGRRLRARQEGAGWPHKVALGREVCFSLVDGERREELKKLGESGGPTLRSKGSKYTPVPIGPARRVAGRDPIFDPEEFVEHTGDAHVELPRSEVRPPPRPSSPSVRLLRVLCVFVVCV